MKAYKKIPLIFVLLLAVFTNLSAAVSAEERAALIALYDSTDSDNWTNSSNWKSGDPCPNSWYGVACSIGNITRLDLGSNQLTGTIPKEIGNLTNLRHLILQDNQLTGSIPVEIVDLGNLTDLCLSFNCNLYSDDTSVQNFIDDVEEGDTYQYILDTNTHDCDKLNPVLAPVIMYLLN